MSERGRRESGSYRPHLDGLRALAVYLVVAFHAGIDGFRGGFIGVDVFFVLSGYLVTGLLVRDLGRPQGRIDLARFYSRRARRLLPAAGIALVATALAFATIAAPVEFADARGGIRAASLYFANWHFLNQSADYFATDINANPVVHYWSLSVEEQFYLLWPLLLGGLYAITRWAGARQMLVVRLVIATAGLCSLAAALSLSGDHLNRAYYGTDTRAYQLLAGAVIAVSPGIFPLLRRAPVAKILPAFSAVMALGLLVAASHFVGLDPIRRGAVVTLLTGALIVSLEAAPRDFGRRLLSWAPLTYLGRVSYGTYLWHWLVIVVLARRADLSPLATAAVASVVATGLASVSYQIVEQPIRMARVLDRPRLAVITSGLAISLLVGLVAAPRILDSSTGGSTPEASAAGVGGVPSQPDIKEALDDVYDTGSCQIRGPVACPLTTGSGKTAIVVGESHAVMLTPLLIDLAKRHDLALSAGYLGFCPWTRGLQYTIAAADCLDQQANLFDRVIPDLDPDIVFLVHRSVDDTNNSMSLSDGSRQFRAGSEAQAEILRKVITMVVSKLRADGRTVVMVEPIPLVAKDQNTLTCLSGASSVDECRFVTARAPGGEERVMRDLAAVDDKVVSVDLDRQVCPNLPFCDPVVRGLIVKRDENHLTTRFGRALLDPVDRYLTAQGVFG